MARTHKEQYTSTRQDWRTPHNILKGVLNLSAVERFDMDAACSDEHVPARRYLKAHEVDSLKTPWGKPGDLVWCNPPYDHAELFTAKAFVEARRGVKVWFLVPARTDTQYQHRHGIREADLNLFIYTRVCFLDENGNTPGSAPFPTLLHYYGDDWGDIAQRFEQGHAADHFGATLMRAYGDHSKQPLAKPRKSVLSILHPQPSLFGG